MQSSSTEIPAATDNTIATANAAAADKTADNADTQKKAEAISNYLMAMKRFANRHNTPFDGRKRKKKVAKARNKRKANKKRKLYIRYGKQ